MIGLIVSAGILGIIITVMEDGEFPGWFPMIVCVLAVWLPALLIAQMVPPELAMLGVAVGACCGGVAISALCGMTVKRASIAAGIYLAIRLSFELFLIMMYG